MQSIFEAIRTDLSDLYHLDIIRAAKNINDALNSRLISDLHTPMYFSGKEDAPLVFIMLNPGGDANTSFSFEKEQKHLYTDIDHFIREYVYQHRNIGLLDKTRIDNFDLKQAAFLFHFKNSGIYIPDFIKEGANNRETKLQAKENVLMQKLQLELLPYRSVTFNGVIDNDTLAEKNLYIFLPYITRIFDAIVEHPREYVIFGAKQFMFLFKALAKRDPHMIQLSPIISHSIEGLKNKVSGQNVTIRHKGHIIKAVIAHSFPRRDLPNAFNKMSLYGKWIYENYIK